MLDFLLKAMPPLLSALKSNSSDKIILAFNINFSVIDISCQVCGRVLFKGYGQCIIELSCARCNREIVALLDDERVMVLENRRGSCKGVGTGQVRVSVQKTKRKVG